MESKGRQQGRKGRKGEQTGSSPGDDQAALIREHVRKMMLKLRESKER
jgi:hypothetical protein